MSVRSRRHVLFLCAPSELARGNGNSSEQCGVLVRQETHISTVRMPIDDLWVFLSDYDNVVHLATSAGEAEWVSGESHHEGARYRATIPWEGIPSRFSAELDEAERPTLVVWYSKSQGSTSSLRFELEPIDDSSTRAHVTLMHDMGGATAPLEPFSWALMTRLFERMMRRLHELRPQQPA